MAVEAELSVLRRDIKLTSAPKKQAMELMRRKIEARTKPARDTHCCLGLRARLLGADWALDNRRPVSACGSHETPSWPLPRR
jgi:hypothetical protein